MKLDWKKALLYPLIVYAVMFLLVSAMIAFNLDTSSTLAWVVTAVVNVGVLYYLATKLDTDVKGALIYGVIWLAVLAACDYLFTRPFTGTQYFSDWRTWLAYAYTVVIPPLTVLYLKRK